MAGDLLPRTGIFGSAATVPALTVPKPTVSVIVPVHNRSMMIGDVIASVLAQTYRAVELVIVDDGSDEAHVVPPGLDGATCGVAVSVVRKAHGGVSSARNLGVARSTGDYIAFLDSDDLLFADALAGMVALLERSGAAYCIGRIVDTDFDLGHPRMSNDPAATDSILHAGQWNTHASLYRRAAVEAAEGAAGPFDEALEIGEDVVFQTRTILQFGRGERYAGFVGVRRRHNHGHLSWGRSPDREARYIKAMATVIASHAAFRREAFRDRLFWTASFLQRVLALGGSRRPGLVAAYRGIVEALMHDAPRLRRGFVRLARHDRGLPARGAGLLLTAMRWVARTLAAWRRRRHDREVRGNQVRGSLRGLRNAIDRSRAYDAAHRSIPSRATRPRP